MKRCLSIGEAAEILRVCIPTLRKWRAEKRGPKCSMIGKKILYREEDILQFLNETQCSRGEIV